MNSNSNGKINRGSLRDYVPKVLGGNGDSVPPNSPYGKYYGQNSSLPNGINHRANDKRELPRTAIDSAEVNYSSDPFPRFRQSYRSKSFDPDLRPEPINRPEIDFSTVDNRRSKRYSKHSTRNLERRRDKNSKNKSQRMNGNSVQTDRIHRSYSAGRANRWEETPYQDDNRILSSNLDAGTYVVVQKDPVDGKCTIISDRRRDRSPSIEGRPNVCYSVKYKPVNGVYMYQTKL